MGTFLICWLPFFIVNIWRSLNPTFFPQHVFQVIPDFRLESNRQTIQIVTWLGYANSTANPVIYGIFNRDFRTAFTKIAVKLFYCCDDEAAKRRSFCNNYQL